MRILSYGGYTFETMGLLAGLPMELPGPDVMPQETALSGQAAVPSAPLIGVRAVPVTFQVKTGFETEDTFAALLGALDVLNPTPRRLVAVRRDATQVAVDAFPGSWVKLARNQMSVTFYMREPAWRELTATTFTKVFTGAIDTALALPLGGEAPVWPRIRIQPTVQRTVKSVDYGWSYRKRGTVTSTAQETLYAHPYRLALGSTTALVSGTKALSSGNDLRILDSQGRQLRRNLVTWNTSASYAWVILPVIHPGESITLDVIYGNASAGIPPTFTYDSDNPYETTVLDLANSTHLLWDWDVQDVAANANRGIWYINSGIEDHEVPGSWDRALYYDNRDDYNQDPWTSFVDGATYGIAILRMFRYKSNVISNVKKREYDGVMLHCPAGMVDINLDLEITNEKTVTGLNLPVGRVEIFARWPGRDWAQIYMERVERRSGLGNTITSVFNRSLLSGSVPATHVMIVGGPYDGIRIPRSAQFDKGLDLRNNNVLQVTLADTVAFSLGAEEEVVQVAGTAYIGGGQPSALAAPRDEVLVGMFTDDERVLLVPYLGGGTAADVLHIETDGGRLQAAIWSASGLIKRDDVSWAVHAQRVEWDNDAELIRSGVRPVLRPGNEQVPNTTFATDITGWQAGTNTAAVTSTTTWVTGALQLAVTANTGGTGDFASSRTTTAVPIEPGQGATFAADVQTTNVNVVPELHIVWLDGAGTEFAEVNEPNWTPAATGTVYRRQVGGTAPPGTVSVRYRLRTRMNAAAATGTIRMDNIDTTPNELVWVEPVTTAGTRISLDAYEGYY